jgi:hypothetical protein
MPIGRAKRALCAAIALAAASMAGPGLAQPSPALGEKIKDAVASCRAQLMSGALKTHAETIICADGPITRAFQDANFPDMDLVFELESEVLAGASKLDHGEITQGDFETLVEQAVLHMNATEASRADGRAAHAQAERQQQEAATQAQADEQQAQAEAAAQQRRQAAISILMGQMNRQQQSYQQQLETVRAIGHSVPPANSSTNCVTQSIGGALYTDCH